MKPKPGGGGPLRRLLKALGPGLITGAADDDPSGIATYSQAGAQFGYALTWTVFLTLPFMAAIQIISAVIGWQTRQGLTRNLALSLPAFALYTIIALLVMANTINIAADLAAMGEALRLVIGGPSLIYALAFGAACLAAEVFGPALVEALLEHDPGAVALGEQDAAHAAGAEHLQDLVAGLCGGQGWGRLFAHVGLSSLAGSVRNRRCGR